MARAVALWDRRTPSLTQIAIRDDGQAFIRLGSGRWFSGWAACRWRLADPLGDISSVQPGFARSDRDVGAVALPEGDPMFRDPISRRAYSDVQVELV